MRIYLAGGLYSNWQTRVKTEANNHTYYDPRTDTDQRRIYNIASQDLAGVDWCDLILVCYENDNPSGVGLGIEVGYGIARGKRVIVVDEHSRINGFLASCGEKIFSDLNVAIKYLVAQNK